MTQDSLRSYVLLGLLAVAGAVVFALSCDDTAPAASVDLRFTRAEAMERGAAFLHELGYDVRRYTQDAWFGFTGDTHLFLQSRGGMRSANAALRSDSIAAHHWYMTWYDRKLSASQMPETFHLWMSPAGRILGFSHVIRDSAAGDALTPEEAQSRAEAFLSSRGVDLRRFTLTTSSRTTQMNRLDHRFAWTSGDSLLEGKITLTVQGSEIGGYRLTHEPGATFAKEFSGITTASTFLGTASFAVFFFLFFFIVILFLRRYHEGEVGTGTGLLVFVGLFSAMLLHMANAFPVVGTGVTVGDLNRANTRLLIFGVNALVYHLFVGVLVFAAWSVGESTARSVWPQKMTGVDSLLHWKLNTIDVARGLLRGFLWGLILLGAYAGAMAGVLRTGVTGVYIQGIPGLPEAFLPAFRPFFAGITGAALTEIIFRLFFLSYLRGKLKRTWPAVGLSTLLMIATTFVVWDVPFGFASFWISVATLLAFGLAFCALYLKYDLLTTLTANFVVIGLSTAIPLFTASGEAFQTTRWIALALIGIPLPLSAAGFIARKRFAFTPQTLPVHIQRITQRERMAKELEIARRVQMSLLPKADPRMDGYDISGLCIPALEVGGDYYDFVSLGGGKIGIAIGDVSGKGVPAAIYMTLTKGILQSHAEDHVSPKRVLGKVNNLMYRTIERNTFVSMLYAVLDPGIRTLRFARAGQCPVVVAQRSGGRGTFLTPRGMALGLERGEVFDAVLEEQEIPLPPGEVLVFHTDGFTEAMNEQGEEFGEDRLIAAIARHRERSARGLIDGICTEVTAFIGTRPQHDDMTMIVVKVLNPPAENTERLP